MPKPVRKVIIPVAGFGTRFLPATKAMPKEMLPIIDTPVIQFLVEEAVASGITDVILVTSGTKRAVEDHFDENETLEQWLRHTKKLDVLKMIQRIGKLANFVYVRQKGPYGNATPVLNCRHLIGDEPFAVLWGDEVFDSKVPRLKQMMKTFERYGDPVLAAIPIDAEGTKRYGVVDPAAEVSPGVYQVKKLIEKPGPEKAPSRIGSVGGYILTPDIFENLTKLKPGHGGEFVLLDAIHDLMKKRPVYAHVLDGEWLDTGSKIGWLRANLKMALKRPEMKDEVKKMMKELMR
ncbi:MAG: hypothetical protein RL141_619 [Candidatus Parcubacteria bacterium]|jgi:UTP--glucose-1-phosphate uridylyltransferase